MVSGTIEYDAGTATSLSVVHAGINTSSGTLDTTVGRLNTINGQSGTPPFSTLAQRISTPVVYLALSSAGTAYLIGQASFSGGTYTCSGSIQALRVH
ncbi:hypothetical protein C6T56_04410 [Burkholderia multivorans]|nr:hypothetical protein C6T56_04410 [Burkholderia multivorans]